MKNDRVSISATRNFDLDQAIHCFYGRGAPCRCPFSPLATSGRSPMINFFLITLVVCSCFLFSDCKVEARLMLCVPRFVICWFELLSQSFCRDLLWFRGWTSMQFYICPWHLFQCFFGEKPSDMVGTVVGGMQISRAALTVTVDSITSANEQWKSFCDKRIICWTVSILPGI